MLKSLIKFNFKIIFKDKISIFWSIILPLVFLLINSHKKIDINEALIYCAYIIVTSYIYGVGLRALRQRESGMCKFIFGLNYQKTKYFGALLISQIIYASLCSLIFCIGASFVLKISFLKLFSYDMVLVFLLINIGFLSYNLTLLKDVHVNSISTITDICVFVGVFLLNSPSKINLINPFYQIFLLINALIDKNFSYIGIYILIFVLTSVLSLYSIKNFSPFSKERRWCLVFLI